MMEESYKEAVAPFGMAWKPFQQHYNRLADRKERLAPGNRKALLDAIKMLQTYPKALQFAEDELKTAETRNPLT